MQITIVLCLFVGVAVAQDIRTLPVAERTEIRDEANQFSHHYRTHDGQYFAERGVLKPTADGRDHVLVKEGTVMFPTPDGTFHRLDYVADEFGFRPKGAHLPVAPEPLGVPPPTF